MKNGAILLTKDGASVGNVCRNTLMEPFSLLSSVAVLRGIPDQLDNEFLVQFLMSPVGQSAIHSEVAGQAITRITLNTIAQLRILLPPLAEQKAIAAVLSAWDRAIGQTAALIAAKYRLKKGLMQQLLSGKRRLRGFKDEWEEKSFGSFMTESRLPGSNGAEARKLTVKLYGKGVIPRQEARTGSEATQYYRRLAGQLIYSKLDFLNGAFGIVPPELDGYESTLDVPAFDIGDSVDRRWLLSFVSRDAFYTNQLGLANGGRKARRVSPNDFIKIKAPMPEKSEQSRIADAIDVFSRDVAIQRQLLTALKQQKRGLMHQLLTGNVRVPNALLKKGAQS